MAMIAHHLGRSVVLLERGTHPRFAIGESSTPLSNLLIEELAARYDLPAISRLSKWGTWQESHPEVACGLKRGFTFFHHELGEKPTARTRETELLVAASPYDRIADTHWYRSDLDWFFVQQASKLGVDYLDSIDLRQCTEEDSGLALRGSRLGEDITLNARFVIDATGPRGFLHRALKLGERELPAMPTTQILFSHFIGVEPLRQIRWDDAPYPVENAAVHHVFDGGWVWLLRFNNGITSAGVVATEILANEWNLREGKEGWARMLESLPELRSQFAAAEAVQPFRYIARPGFRSGSIVGDHWALLPSAAGFVDPLLSTGFSLTLLGITRLAELIGQKWDGDGFHTQLEDYAKSTDDELSATARLIGAIFANLDNFSLFSALTLLYFAAASYSEAAHRLGKPELAAGFLLHDRRGFGKICEGLLSRAMRTPRGREASSLVEGVLRAIEPIDVAGLTRRDRRNWYPVDAEDILDSAAKLGASRTDIQQMLDRCGFRPAILPGA